MDPDDQVIRLEDLVTDEDYAALVEIAVRVVAEHAVLRHTRLAAEFHEVE